MSLVLRRIQEVSADLIQDFSVRTWKEESAEAIQSKWWLTSHYPMVNTVFDEEEGRLAGMVVAIPSHWPLPGGSYAKTVSICGWYVAPDYTGKGLGKLLVNSFNEGAPFYNALSISDAAIHNFRKLGWTGPFHTKLFLMPLPGLRLRPKPVNGLLIQSFVVKGDKLPPDLSGFLDVIENERPDNQIRRRRNAEDWRMHLGVWPNRIQHFHILMRDNHPVGLFVIRKTDSEAGPIYRRLRLHYVTDVVLNTDDDKVMGFLANNMGAVAPIGAGALLLCTNNRHISSKVTECGWLAEKTIGIGPRLKAKAPLYMLGGGLAEYPEERITLTFSDSDVDFNI